MWGVARWRWRSEPPAEEKGRAMPILTRLTAATRILGQIVLAFMTLTICYDAAMRYVFAAPTSWSHEVNTFLIVYIALMAAADTQAGDGHIRITFFTGLMPDGPRRVIRILVGLVGVVFCAILAWRGGLTALQAWTYDERVSSSFGTPLAVPYAMLPIGFGLLAMQFLLEVFRPPAAGASAHDAP